MNNKLHTTKVFYSLEDQVLLLKSRGLIIPDNKYAEKVLLEKNYFDLINGFETLMLVDSKASQKKYEKYYFDDFLFLYNFDKKLNVEILKLLDKFETRLKTSMAYRFCEKNYTSPSKARCYIDISLYSNPINPAHHLSLPREIKRNIAGHKIFNASKFKGYNDFIDFCKSKYNFLNTYDDPPFWMTIKILEFGPLFQLLIAYEKDVFEKVIQDMGMEYAPDKEKFINSIRIFIELRNTCAHFQLVNRFRTPSNLKIDSGMIADLQLHTKLNRFGKRLDYEIKLYDTLLVLGQFENLSEISKLIRTTYNHCNSKRRRDLFLKILERMGRKQISDWTKLK